MLAERFSALCTRHWVLVSGCLVLIGVSVVSVLFLLIKFFSILVVTTELKQEMIAQGRVALRGSTVILYYSIPVSLFLLGAFILGLHLLKPPVGIPQEEMPSTGTVMMVIIFWSIAFGLFLDQRQKLKLEKLTVDLSTNDIKEVLQNLGKRFNWRVVVDTEEIFIADSIRFFSADNRITVFVDGKDIYVNARSDGHKLSAFRQGKLTESILDALRMRHFERQHQRNKLPQS